MNLKCLLGMHAWSDRKCSNCEKMDYPGILEDIYGIGKRLSILRFIEQSKGQFIAGLSKCSNEDEKRRFVSERHSYLVKVIQQMFNPIISGSDVKKLNEITKVLKK